MQPEGKTESQIIEEFHASIPPGGFLPVKTCRCGNCTCIACLDPNQQCDYCNGSISTKEMKKMLDRDPGLAAQIRLRDPDQVLSTPANQDFHKVKRCIIL